MKKINEFCIKQIINFSNYKFKFNKFCFGKIEKGFGTIEMVLIIFVLVSLVILFRSSITDLVQKYLKQLDPNFK